MKDDNLDEMDFMDECMDAEMKAESASDSVQRLVRREVCEECGHLASEHIEGSICGSFYIEEVMLPVCECGATCEDEGDELCLNCWEDRPGYGLQANTQNSDA